MYVREGLAVRFIVEQSMVTKTCENCVIKVNPIKSSSPSYMTVISIYRPPAASRVVFLERIVELLCTNKRETTLIAGDFNWDIVEENNSLDLCPF